MRIVNAVRLAVLFALAGCGPRGGDGDANHEHAAGEAHDHHDSAEEAEPWAVTAWGERYEIFPECDPLVAGRTSKCHTHVTVLADFTPLREGVTSIVLRASNGSESVFRKDQPLRDGIYSIEVTPEAEGVYDLAFRVTSAAGEEEIPGGRVRVGTESEPGGLIDEESDEPHAEAISFLKEQQWRTEFATEWTRVGAVRGSVAGPGRIRAAAGGDALLAAPLDGVVATDARLYVGLEVQRGAAVASLAPRAAGHRTLAEIESDWTIARDRVARLEELLALEAVSQAEVDLAKARLATLEAELDAARGGSGASDPASPAAKRVAVVAPFTGQIAEVFVIPGQVLSAGDPIARLVKTEPLWVEVALPPSAALAGAIGPLHLLPAGAAQPVTIPAENVRLVSRAPSVDAQTGAVTAILEIPGGAGSLAIGTAVEAQIVSGAEREGVVIPATAIVDDAGVPVVYVQAEGEAMMRREIRILSRQGDGVLVEGLEAGERLVTRGGAAIRRASLISSGVGEGHVH